MHLVKSIKSTHRSATLKYRVSKLYKATFDKYRSGRGNNLQMPGMRLSSGLSNIMLNHSFPIKLLRKEEQ